MKVLVGNLKSDACEYFWIEADELTDVGNTKTLLAKVRFPENQEIQTFVFLIFESVGDSESMYEKFLWIDSFEKYTLHERNPSKREWWDGRSN